MAMGASLHRSQLMAARPGGMRCSCIRPAITFLIHEKADAAASRSKTRFKVCSERQRDQDAFNINSGFPAQLGLYLGGVGVLKRTDLFILRLTNLCDQFTIGRSVSRQSTFSLCASSVRRCEIPSCASDYAPLKVRRREHRVG